MGQYLGHFIVYAMAMLGIIMLVIYTYKMTYGVKSGLNSSLLSVTDSMKLTPKKTLYVVKAGDERFLIASDFDSTTLISKLDDNQNFIPKRIDNSIGLNSFDGLESIDDFVESLGQKKSEKKPVLKELVRKLQNC